MPPELHSVRHMNFAPQPNRNRLLRRAITAVGALCAVMLWALLGSFSGSSRTATIGTIPTESPSFGTAPVQPAVPKLLGSGTASSLSRGLEPDTIRYYEPATGRAFVADLRKGQVRVISDRKLSGFIESIWVPGSAKVISLFETQGTREYRLYDYTTRQVSVIGNAVSSLAVSPDGQHIAFVDTRDDAQVVKITTLDGVAERHILSTRASTAQLSWPQKDFLALASRRPDRSGTDVTLIRLDGTLEALFSDLENLEYTWSSDGQKLLFSSFLPGAGISLGYLDLGQRTKTVLPLRTSASKCAWHADSSAITCGVPGGNSLPGDIPADRVATTDDIVTIDLVTGTQTKNHSAQAGTLLGVIHPVMSSSGNFLVFSNIFDQRLHYLEI